MKKLVIVSFFIFLCGPAPCQDRLQPVLNRADSLFNIRKYTESFELYNHLYQNEKQLTPAMLLRMSFIKEGLGDFSNALYYLNLYYLRTANEKALSKMEELAEKKELAGYKFSDFEFFQTMFYKYFEYIICFLIACAILLLAVTYHQKVKLSRPATAPAIFMVFILGLLFYIINFGKDYNKAIIAANNVYVMNGPSAASDVLDIIGKGHRVSIKNQKDIWTRLEWQGKTGYVKSDKLKAITLF